MSRVRIVPVLDEHVDHVADFMRDADVQEIWAASHSLPHIALKASVRRSDRAWCGLVDDEPTAIFGVGHAVLLTGVGVPWLLGTERMGGCAPAVLRTSRKAVAELSGRYPVLRNVIDDRNHISKRWLAWLGFQFSAPFPYGAEKLPFRLFEKRA